MSANNITMIILGITATVRVLLTDAWATNSTFHWLNWTLLVSWYALKIWPRTFKWRDKDSLYHSTAFSNQVLFAAKVMPGEIIGIFCIIKIHCHNI